MNIYEKINFAFSLNFYNEITKEKNIFSFSSREGDLINDFLPEKFIHFINSKPISYLKEVNGWCFCEKELFTINIKLKNLEYPIPVCYPRSDVLQAYYGSEHCYFLNTLFSGIDEHFDKPDTAAPTLDSSYIEFIDMEKNVIKLMR